MFRGTINYISEYFYPKDKENDCRRSASPGGYDKSGKHKLNKHSTRLTCQACVRESSGVLMADVSDSDCGHSHYECACVHRDPGDTHRSVHDHQYYCDHYRDLSLPNGGLAPHNVTINATPNKPVPPTCEYKQADKVQENAEINDQRINNMGTNVDRNMSWDKRKEKENDAMPNLSAAPTVLLLPIVVPVLALLETDGSIRWATPQQLADIQNQRDELLEKRNKHVQEELLDIAEALEKSQHGEEANKECAVRETAVQCNLLPNTTSHHLHSNTDDSQSQTVAVDSSSGDEDDDVTQIKERLNVNDQPVEDEVSLSESESEASHQSSAADRKTSIDLEDLGISRDVSDELERQYHPNGSFVKITEVFEQKENKDKEEGTIHSGSLTERLHESSLGGCGDTDCDVKDGAHPGSQSDPKPPMLEIPTTTPLTSASQDFEVITDNIETSEAFRTETTSDLSTMSFDTNPGETRNTLTESQTTTCEPATNMVIVKTRNIPQNSDAEVSETDSDFPEAYASEAQPTSYSHAELYCVDENENSFGSHSDSFSYTEADIEPHAYETKHIARGAGSGYESVDEQDHRDQPPPPPSRPPPISENTQQGSVDIDNTQHIPATDQSTSDNTEIPITSDINPQGELSASLSFSEFPAQKVTEEQNINGSGEEEIRNGHVVENCSNVVVNDKDEIPKTNCAQNCSKPEEALTLNLSETPSRLSSASTTDLPWRSSGMATANGPNSDTPFEETNTDGQHELPDFDVIAPSSLESTSQVDEHVASQHQTGHHDDEINESALNERQGIPTTFTNEERPASAVGSGTMSYRDFHVEAAEVSLQADLHPIQGPTTVDDLQTQGNAETTPAQSEPRKHIFIIYAKESQIEMWIKRNIEPRLRRDCPNFSFKYLQEELSVPGCQKIECVINNVRIAHKVLVVLSTTFEDCKYARYALSSLIPNMEDKLVPVTIEVCNIPMIITHITHLEHSSQRFDHLLKKALLDSPAPRHFSDKSKAPLRQFKDGQEPFLMLWKRPQNPLEPHFQHSVTVPSTPDRRNDHRIVFRIGLFGVNLEDEEMAFFDRTDRSRFAPRYEIRLKINKVYKVISNSDERKEMNKGERSKCIRFWKDIYRQPKNEEEMKNEIGFWLRFKNPQDAHKIIAYLTFDLLMTVTEKGKSQEHLVHSLNLDFETKPKKPKLKPKPVRKKSGVAADDDDDDTERRPWPDLQFLRDWIIKLGTDGKPLDQTVHFSPTDGVLGRKRSPIIDAFSFTAFSQRHATGAIDPNTGVEETIEEEVDEIGPLRRLGNLHGRGSRYIPRTNWTISDRDIDQMLNAGGTVIETRDRDVATFSREEMEEFEEEQRLWGNLVFKTPSTVYPKPGLFRKKKYHDMCYELECLGEKVKEGNGAEIFHNRARELLNDFKSRKMRTDEQIVILLKQSGVEHFRNRLSQASDYVRQALDLVPRAQYRHQMEARIYYYISSIYREKKKFGKAKFWIKRSKEMLKYVEPGEDTAKAYYNEGRLYMKILTSTMRHEECRKLALTAFDKALQHAKHDYETYGVRLDVKLLRRCYLNMARICVDVPEMPAGRNREIVTLEDLQMAKLCLDAVKMPEYWSNPSTRNQAHLGLAECGFFFRKAEMLHRMTAPQHKANAKKNLTNAIQRANSVLNLPGIEEFKEHKLTEEFKKEMEESYIFVKGIHKTSWPHMRRLLDSASSSDLTQGSSEEVRSSTSEDERRKKMAAPLFSSLAEEDKSGDMSDSNI